ncbi:MAG: hypothetical protein HOQ22_18630 [Nocardioidaceae bacterium]|nr:hypothetical protein [Nocardioidaceae bacterium]NUS53041.1 hypothetical protein [Nocardioidaceae bacterium]
MPDHPGRELTNFRSFCDIASGFWDTNVRRDPSRVILVEAMSQDLRVTLRNLSVANALRRIEPAELVVFGGADDDWNEVVWSYFDLDEIEQLCRAYGARHFFDVHRVVDDRVAGRRFSLDVAGIDLGGPLPDSVLDPLRFEQIVDATSCRMAKVARLDGGPEHTRRRARDLARSTEFARVYDALLSELDVVAVVSSHVDYNNFGLAVEAAVRHDVPVLFPQSTGGLKVYGLYPERQRPGSPVRAGLTEELGQFFEHHVWEHRDLLRRSADLTTYRSKAMLGRPSWWRPGRSFSSVELRGPDDRADVRKVAAARTGLDPDKPVVTVFNHAVSDALGTNVEAFPDLGAWFEATAEIARDRDDVNWLFLDHPSQSLYDATAFFAQVAARHTDRPHLVFMRSMDLSKNSLISLTDLVLTVRGSVSNEYPALGIPAIQTGWSEWSACGFTTVADSPDDYAKLLDDHITGLHDGDRMVTPEQVERARLWTWFYRAGSDVPSGLVQPWQLGQGDSLIDLLSVQMLHVESDADPLFSSLHRMWTRRDPVATRVDLAAPTERLAVDLGVVTR